MECRRKPRRAAETPSRCWFNIFTPEPARARSFFGKLLGWTYVDTDMGHTVQLEGHDIAGLFDLVPRTPKGTPPLIGLMVKVKSADATAKKVRALGGKAKPPFDIGPAGRMSVCHDPSGADFDVWEPRGLPGWEVDANTPGAPTWFKTTTRHLDQVAKFYSALFGWKADSASPENRTFYRGGRPVGAAKHSVLAGSRPNWRTYFAVKEVEAATRKAVKLGGKVLAPVTTLKGSRFAGIRYPQGVQFYVMQRGARRGICGSRRRMVERLVARTIVDYGRFGLAMSDKGLGR